MEIEWTDWSVYKRDWIPGLGWRCLYCGFIANDYLSFRQLSIDHIIPKGNRCKGEETDVNKIVVCKRCNEMKNQFDPRDNGSIETCPTAVSRPRYITAAKQYVEIRDHEGKRDFEEMLRQLDEIRAKKAAG